MAMKRGKFFVLCGLGALWISAWPVAAQSGVELSHGYFHMLHAQPPFSDESRDDLPPLKADAYTLHDTPFDLPIRKLPKRPGGIGRAVTNPLESGGIQPAVGPKTKL